MRKLKNKNLVQAAIRKSAKEHRIVLHELSVMPDYIHILASFPHRMTDSEALQILKGRSAYLIFKNKERFRLRYPQGLFCSAGGFASTVGNSDLSTTTAYIQNQSEHHNVAFT